MIRGWYNQNKKHQCHWGTESTTDDTNRDGSLSSPWTSIEEKNPQSWPSNQRPPPSWATAPICWCRARRPCQLHHVRPQQRDADSCTICPILIQQIFHQTICLMYIFFAFWIPLLLYKPSLNLSSDPMIQSSQAAWAWPASLALMLPVLESEGNIGP